MNLDTVEIKAFVPARDMDLSLRFYRDLGFAVPWSSGELAFQCLHAGESGESPCIDMIDVDRFKRFNDRHGRLGGDLSPKRLLQLGDEALYAAKQAGRNRYVIRKVED